MESGKWSMGIVYVIPECFGKIENRNALVKWESSLVQTLSAPAAKKIQLPRPPDCAFEKLAPPL
jgi:hypothetical protein